MLYPLRYYQQFIPAVERLNIAIASYVMTKTKPKRELRREAPQLSFGFYVLAYLAMAILDISGSSRFSVNDEG